MRGPAGEAVAAAREDGGGQRIAFVASDNPAAQEALRTLAGRYAHVDADDADTIVALGGDGFMLQTLHRYFGRRRPIFGMNFGSVGFLMNEYRPDDLPARLAAAKPVRLYPLRMDAETIGGALRHALAINEVSLLRQTRQTAKIAIAIDGITRMEELFCDGMLVSTPAGSTAYNFSAHGPILPLGADVLALTPISAFRPRHWRGAILPHRAHVTFTVHEPDKRPVSAVADGLEVRNVRRVTVS